MCDPGSMTMLAGQLALSALTTGIGYMAQQEAADSANAYQKAMHEQTTENALQAYRNAVDQENQRVIQSEDAAAQEIQKIQQERLRKSGEAIASSNAAGMSMDALMGDFLRQEGNYKAAIEQQLQWERQQSQANMKGHGAQARSRIAGTMYQPHTGPSPLGTLASFGSSSLGIYGNHTAAKGKK